MAYHERNRKYPCGVCGDIAAMTKAHVPPKCAGNREEVHRSLWMVNGMKLEYGRPEKGGIWYLGQCKPCNSRAGEVFDPAYGEFADALRPLWQASLDATTPRRLPLPHIECKPGAVARSILLAMCATTPMIRDAWPDVQVLLDMNSAVTLPTDFKLYLALSRGKTAWVQGTSAGYYKPGPRYRTTPVGANLILMTFAAVYFPPLAWRLVTTGSQMLDEDGWLDVSNWCQFPPAEVRYIDELVPTLPSVRHPMHEPGGDTHWREHPQTDVSSFIECLDITGKNTYEAGARRRTMSRYLVPMEEMERLVGLNRDA